MASGTGSGVGEIIGFTFAFIGLAATMVGWNFRGRQQKFLATRKDVNDSIDKALKSLAEFEDSALAYWTEKDTKVTQHHLIILHKRLVISCKQVSELSRQALPGHLLAELKKNTTLDYESARRPISSNAFRVSRIFASSSKLLDSPFLMKTWVSVSEPKISDVFRKAPE